MAADLILNNPFRVLGLPATAGARDIAKRVSDLETFAELGKSKAYPLDIEGMGPIDRGLEAIKDAARRIEQNEGRLFHSFFWFRSANSVDALALESLRDSSVHEALDLWEKQLSKKGKKQYTWLLNRSILRLFLSSEQGFDREEFDNALADLGFVIDDHLDDSIEDVLGGANSGINRESLWKKIVDELLLIAKAAPNAPYGVNSVQIIDSFWSFPHEAKDYVNSKVINPLVEVVQKAIEDSKRLRSDKAQLPALRRNNGLDKVEYIILELETALGEESPKFQSIANAYADELCSCAVTALNQYDEVGLASMYIEWAAKMPSFARVQSRIEENRKAINVWVESKKSEDLYGAVVKLFDVELQTIEQAGRMLESMRTEVSTIGATVGLADGTYLKMSSSCVNHILDFLVTTVNAAQESFATTKDLADFYSIIDTASELTRKLSAFHMDAETTSRWHKNLDTIQSMVAALVKSSDGDNTLAQIPAWVWIVALMILIAIFR
jgi:hypothetical protein